MIPQRTNGFARFRVDMSQAEFDAEVNEAVARQFPKLNKLRADVAEIPGLLSEIISTPEGKLLAKEASTLRDQGTRILASDEFKAVTEQASVVFAGIKGVLSTPQAAAFLHHLHQVGREPLRDIWVGGVRMISRG